MAINTNWHSWDTQMLCQTLKTDPARGMSRQAAAKRISKSGPNRIWRVKRASASEFAVQMLLDLATILLVIFAIIAGIFEKSIEAPAIIAVVVIGGALRIFIYIRAQRIFEEKARGVIPRVRVIRDGEVAILSAERLVEGDIVFLETGDTVPADLRILSSSGLLVYENRITDNKGVVFKNADVINEEPGNETPLENRANMLYAGSTVAAGEARAVVVSTGAKTLVASKFGTLHIPSGEKIKLVEKLSKWCRAESLFMIAAVAVITVIGIIMRSASAVRLLLTSLALAVASMSEFFTVLGYIVIATSVKKADSEESGRAKIKDAATVEVLNETDTIVVADPGMLKAGDITLTSYFLSDRIVNVDEPVEGYSPAELLKLAYITTGSLPQGALTNGFMEPERESTSVDYSGIHKVFEEYFRNSYESRAVENTVMAGHEAAGSAESGGLDTSLICRAGNFEAVVSGQVENVLSCCNQIRKNGKVLPLTREDVALVTGEAARLRSRGVFTVGIATRNSPYVNMNRVSALQMCMVFEGFLSLSDRVHGDALDAIRKCREGDTRMVCFTEGSDEDRAFLESVNFLTEKDRYITFEEASASEVITLEKSQFAAIATGTRNPAKVRREFLSKLTAGGSVLSYVTDDPKDMWTMKEVPVSFAAPKPSSVKKTIPQSIRAASHVVVTPAANGGGVFEAFRVTEFAKSAMMNLRRCANYLIASQTARLIYVLASAIFPFAVADPIHLLLWGLIFDFAVVLVTAFRDPPWNMISIPPEKRRLQGSPIEFAKPAAAGLLWALLILMLPAVFLIFPELYKPAHDTAVLSNLIFVSAIISIPVMGAQLMTNKSIFMNSSKARSKAIPLMFPIFFVVSLFFAFSKKTAALLGVSTLNLKLFLLSLVPALIMLAVFEIAKIVKGKNKR